MQANKQLKVSLSINETQMRAYHSQWKNFVAHFERKQREQWQLDDDFLNNKLCLTSVRTFAITNDAPESQYNNWLLNADEWRRIDVVLSNHR